MIDRTKFKVVVVVENLSEELPNNMKFLASPKLFSCSKELLLKVFDFIETNYQQPITLRDVAQAVGYSPAYLTHQVRCQTGQTVNHWIIQCRMAATRTLLLDSNQSINQIAETVGYQNIGHFFRQFRQYHGVTPQAWRNRKRLPSKSL